MLFDDFLEFTGLGSLFRLFKGQVASSDTVSRAAVASYDHLMTDYSRTTRIPVIRNGQLYYAQANIADLGYIIAAERDRAETDMRRALEELRAGAFFSYDNPGTLRFSPTAYPGRGVAVPNVSHVYDSRISAPGRFLEYPPRVKGLAVYGGMCDLNVNAFDTRWPNAQGVRPMFATSKLFTDRTAFPDTAVIQYAGRLCDALLRYMRASNVNVRRNPLTIAMMVGPEYPGDKIPPTTGASGEQVARLKRKQGAAWEAFWIRNWERFIQLPPGQSDPASSTFRINTTPLILESLRQRMKVGSATPGDSGDHEASTWADPMMEFCRLVQVCEAALQIGDPRTGPQAPLSHLQATCLSDQILREAGYIQLNLPQSSNLFAYTNRLAQEREAAARKRESDIFKFLSLGRYQASDGTGFSGAAVATMELATALAPIATQFPVGTIVALVAAIGIGLAALALWLTGDDPNAYRPDLYQLRDRAGNCFLGINATDAILESPVLRHRLSEARL